jgi:DNA-binding MarR family transcriptional regulator
MPAEADLWSTANALRRAVGQVKRRMRNRETGTLSAPEGAVLSQLDRHGPDTVAGLARWEQVTPQTMGATVRGLESRGLIHRHPDPGDGRRRLLSLTDSGSHLLHDVRDEATERIAHALGGHLTDEEIKCIREAAPLIERLAQYL